MQHDLFHAYTVDEHTLFVVRNLRRFTVPEYAHEFPLCSRIIEGFARQEILLAAALFHDIAKGRGGDHSRLGARDARRFCRQHGLDEEDTGLVCWLVENHLVMSATAQKQDISDPDVIAAFAARAGDERHLSALYLLTVADIRGTSPQVWNAWKGKLLEDLYQATLRYLGERGQTPAATYLEERQAEALSLLSRHAFPAGEHLPLWRQLDDSYFLRHDANEIAWHARVLHGHENAPAPLVRARVAPIGEGLQVLIYSPAHDYLFARICSFFERAHYNIAEAKIHTTRHGYALDSFVVLDEGQRASHYRDILNYVEHELALYLTDASLPEPAQKHRLSRQSRHFPIPPQVNIAPDEKNTYHILSLVAGDRPGLLSQVAEVLVKHHVHLHTAKITTLGERAEDTFLITGDILQKPKEILRLETDLLERLQPPGV
jgi:[protein-PII] uridylyltransferase